MEFNMLDGVSTQEIMLMKKAIAKLQEPTNESQLVTVKADESTVVEGKYTGFSCKIPASYTELITITVNDVWGIRCTPGCIYQLKDGVLYSNTTSSTNTSMSIAPDTTHAIQKFSVIDKLEISVYPVSQEPMGLEFDLVLSK